MTVNPNGYANRQPLKVAIIGGGPGGLGTAIALGKLPFIDWTLYEKKPQISETGGGITLQRHTWKMLEWNGSAKHVKDEDIFRTTGSSGQFRNGRTGEFIHEIRHTADTPQHQISGRMVRGKFQAALLKEVDHSRVKVSKKLVSIAKLPNGKVLIEFEDGETDEVDLLVAADGIRSSIRSVVFPTHKIKYNGQSAYRTIISKSAVDTRLGIGTRIPKACTFWQNLNGRYIFTSPLGNDDFEVTARIQLPSDGQDQVSWGRPFDFSKLVPEYDGFCEELREIVKMVAEAGSTQEFALFSGPRMDEVVAWDAVALVGDASHPLSGAFGAGAGFALEDTYALYRSLEWAWRKGGGDVVGEALKVFDGIRSPHYRELYETLDWLGGIMKEVSGEGLSVDEEIKEKVLRTNVDRASWMYDYDIHDAVASVLGKAVV